MTTIKIGLFDAALTNKPIPTPSSRENRLIQILHSYHFIIMQVFIKCLSGKTITLDVNRDGTVKDVMILVEKSEGIPVPRQRLIFAGKQLEQHHTFPHKIKPESTIHLCLRMAQQIFIQWQGKWLMSKDNPKLFHSFWDDLTNKNLVRVDYSDNYQYAETVENLTIYHLKKQVAKFLVLKPGEMILSYYKDPDIVLEDNLLLENSWAHFGIDFIAKLNPSDVELK